MVQLLQQAAVAKPLFDDLVTSVAATVEGVELSISDGLKRASRIVEKVCVFVRVCGVCLCVGALLRVFRCVCVCR